MTAEKTNHQSQEGSDHPDESISNEDSCYYTMMDADEAVDDRCSERFCCCC